MTTPLHTHTHTEEEGESKRVRKSESRRKWGGPLSQDREGYTGRGSSEAALPWQELSLTLGSGTSVSKLVAKAAGR